MFEAEGKANVTKGIRLTNPTFEHSPRHKSSDFDTQEQLHADFQVFLEEPKSPETTTAIPVGTGASSQKQ
jgi:hypothetical protein